MKALLFTYPDGTQCLVNWDNVTDIGPQDTNTLYLYMVGNNPDGERNWVKAPAGVTMAQLTDALSSNYPVVTITPGQPTAGEA